MQIIDKEEEEITVVEPVNGDLPFLMTTPSDPEFYGHLHQSVTFTTVVTL